MKITYEVRFWDIKVLKSGKRRYGIRWVTGSKRHSRYYETKALANSRRSELMQAARRGEAFDIESGLPASELKQRDELPSNTVRSTSGVVTSTNTPSPLVSSVTGVTAVAASTSSDPRRTATVRTRPDRRVHQRASRTRLTITEICADLGISRSTFYEWRIKGRAPRCIKLPNGDIRISRAEYERWLTTLEEAA